MWRTSIGVVALLASVASCWPYDESLLDYNINQNKSATNPADYWGEWPDHQGAYHPSPDNWRFPFYTLFMDRFVNGDPTNDNINGSQFEHDLDSNQMRHGGDVAGLLDTLDYLQGMGIKVRNTTVADDRKMLTATGLVPCRHDLDEPAMGF
jgi:alpha-1,3-glucan synthase